MFQGSRPFDDHSSRPAIADGLELPVEQILFYDWSHLVQANCSHMVVLPPLTSDGHLLVGRSYEWKPEEDDLRLCTTRIEGRQPHQ